MGKFDKLLNQILFGQSDANFSFSEVRQLLIWLGFNERIKGDHHIFSKTDVAEILNLQPKNSKMKIYQVKQIRNLIIKYKLRGAYHE